MFTQPADRGGQFAAERHALHEPQQHQQNRRGRAQRGIAGQQRNEHGARGHAHDGVREDRGATAPVAKVRPQQSAERAREVADGEHREGLERAHPTTGLGREEGCPDLPREHREDHEVVELEHPAERRDGGRAQHGSVGGPVAGHRPIMAWALPSRMSADFGVLVRAAGAGLRIRSGANRLAKSLRKLSAFVLRSRFCIRVV